MSQDSVLISDGDVKIEVAKAIQRHVGGDLHIDLKGSSESLFCRDLQQVRKWRRRIVNGSYTRNSGKTDMTLCNHTYKEVVVGGVQQHATVEGESIIGGAYIANHIGLFMRITAFADFMAWGGWAEVDAIRVELCLVGIRSYMGYAHAAVGKQILAGNLFDDWVNRTENFGSLNETHTQVTILPSGPGAVTHQDN